MTKTLIKLKVGIVRRTTCDKP